MSDPASEIAAIAENAPEVGYVGQTKPNANRADLDSYVLPPDCPVTPLGHFRKVLYVLDVDGQLVELAPKLPKEDIVYIWGRQLGWLEANQSLCAWKAVGKDKKTGNVLYEPDGFDQRKVQVALTLACRDKGFIDMAGKLRGRGSHRDTDGNLILHCGDKILRTVKSAKGQPKKPEWQKPGMVGKLIFPTGPDLPHPTEKPAEATDARALLSILSLWNWKGSIRVMVDGKAVPLEALLLLGWIGCAKLCGAIGWRPHIWLTGHSGAGKSTLQGVISRILAEWALESQDPSEAWISQSLADQRLAVLYDEPEPGEGEDSGAFVRKVIKLARLASSGGKRGRGSADHKAVDFAIYSCFLFSSIMHHQLEAQDRNRMAILSLDKFPPGTTAMDVDAIERLLPVKWGFKGDLNALGLGLSRRLVEQWPRYQVTLGAYQAELMQHRADPRQQTTYGEMLAMADMLLFDSAPIARDVGDPNPPEDSEAEGRCARFVDALLPVLELAAAETENVAERCLGRLTQFRLTASAGKHQETVGRWIQRALADVLLRDGVSRSVAAEKLKAHGLRLVHLREAKDDKRVGAVAAMLDPDHDPVYLAVAGASNEALKQIFAKTPWQGGEWHQALGMVPGAISQYAKIRFDGPVQMARLVPIGEIIDIEAAREEARQRMATAGDNPQA